ncbi:MAG: CPBP family intramembrane metalloprotease [Phycisphaerales bacterium]|nr:CPBP family intramembrane metalloprotease [Phycisphaerales bacterium]
MGQRASQGPGQSGWRRDGPRFALVAWVIATLALTIAVTIALAAVATIATARAAIGGVRSGVQLEVIAKEAIGSGAAPWIMVIASQAVLLACAWLACRVLGKPARERLGLVATNLGPLPATILLVATTAPFALGIVAAWLVERVVGSPNGEAIGLQRMWYEGSRLESAGWIVLIALLPGFAEEVFYRGFLQRGLLLRWKPTASIATSSLLFAVVHGDPVSAAAVFPLGLWLGVVAWRCGSVVMTFAMHAGINGLWTAGMMILHRAPASESILVGIALAATVVGVVAFPWAMAILRRQPGDIPSASGTCAPARRPLRLLPRVAFAVLGAGVLSLLLVPAGTAQPAPDAVAERSVPSYDELEANATESIVCRAMGDGGAAEFLLRPGIGVRVTLPPNRLGINTAIVMLDDTGATVWLAYAGERSGKGGARRPAGIVEQLAAGDPTVLSMTLSPGPPPVRVRLTLEEDEAGMVAAFEQATAKGWARRGRDESIICTTRKR